jgi:hypothetical protein
MKTDTYTKAIGNCGRDRLFVRPKQFAASRLGSDLIRGRTARRHHRVLEHRDVWGRLETARPQRATCSNYKVRPKVQELGCHGIVESGVFGPHSFGGHFIALRSEDSLWRAMSRTRHVEREGLLVHPVPDGRRHEHRAQDAGGLEKCRRINWKHGRYSAKYLARSRASRLTLRVLSFQLERILRAREARAQIVTAGLQAASRLSQ